MKVVSEQLGHSSLAITADTYTNVLPEVGQAAAEAVAAIVPRQPKPAIPNGEFDATCTIRAHEATKEAEKYPTPAENSKKTQVRMGEPRGTRTHNPRIKSPLLCQLS